MSDELSLEAECARLFAIAKEYDAFMADGPAQALGVPFVIWRKNRRTAPVSAPLDTQALPLLTDDRIGELYLSVRQIGHATNRELAFARAVEQDVRAPYAERISLLEQGNGLLSLIADQFKVRLASADERIAHLERENEAHFQRCDEMRDALAECKVKLDQARGAYQGCATALEIAGSYIDGRTAGTAPSDELRKKVNAHCNDLLDCAAILHDDGRFLATAAEIRLAVAELKNALDATKEA